MDAMGITRIANVTGLDYIGIPVVMVCRPNSRSVSVAQGKGISLAAAEASGLMESVESHHAERIVLPLKLATHKEMLPNHRVVDLERLPRISNSAFHPELPMLWIEGKDLVQGKAVWLPYELVHTNYTLPYPPGSGCFMASSNGLASGNHVLEATSHGITEVVERDSTALWHGRVHVSPQDGRLDLDSVDDPHCRDLLEKFRCAGIKVAVWDATTDIGIASFQCWIREDAPSTGALAQSTMGSGCHPARHVALSRALTEAAQDRLAIISGARDDLRDEDYIAPVDAEVERRRDAIFADATAPRRFQDVPTMELETLEEDVAWEVERLTSVGIEEVVIVDLTKHGQFDIPVVRVVIPGLEGLVENANYVPGPRARNDRRTSRLST